jgi:hypothetical protein
MIKPPAPNRHLAIHQTGLSWRREGEIGQRWRKARIGGEGGQTHGAICAFCNQTTNGYFLK